MAVVEKLGRKEFRRRLVAGSFPRYPSLRDGIDGLRFVQADPIRSPARAQDLILRQRVDGYVAGQLEEEFPKLEAEEGYLFAYGFMPREVWRHLRSQPSGKLSQRKRDVLAAVEEMGDVRSRDLDDLFGKRSVRNYWGGTSRESKRILEDLHDEGYLRVSRREKGNRIYAVIEEAWSDVDPAVKYRALLETTAHVFGPVSKRFLLSEIRFLNHLMPKRRERDELVDRLVGEGALSWLSVDGIEYLWVAESWGSLEVSDRVRILAPFDPLVRDRERFEQVFGWEYRFEAYVPAKKRMRGYYAMPLLWRDEVVGWANAKVEDERLKVEFGYVGSSPRTKVFRKAAEREVEAMAMFLGLGKGCWEIRL
ncbi:DNA glycosylase AlkZ-like family protein [Pelagicoccus mobilis]|uniref:YcaQ family DNA glycosylase n=1 Tax=Pelagicoccus mobilis TaxID=415221 RepID=A0A934S681_9BACT|nr:crosslink repair DNA glycosylase YcaQ family protein [Pelagicoccus mobilis]MBK1880497.1 YcaQ family DNA glycosylase [Pelagicoccus mobilis]